MCNGMLAEILIKWGIPEEGSLRFAPKLREPMTNSGAASARHQGR